MSLVSIAAGKIQILVGDDNQDWSDAFVSLSLNDPEVDDSGKLPITGRLTLAVLANPPDSQDPLSSAGRSRWAKGQRILINYQKSTGTWARHPRGWLYIAKPPTPPQIGYPAYLEIEVVCCMQLQTFPVPRGVGITFTPDFDASGGKPLNLLTRGDCVAQCFTQAGITRPWVGSISKFPVALDIRKSEPNAFTELAGKIAYGGLSIIAQTNQGELTAYSVNATTSAPVLTLDEAQCVSIEFLDPGETPCEKVIFSANQSVQIGLVTSDTRVFEDKGSAQSISTDFADLDIVIKRTTRTEQTSPTRKTVSERIEEPAGLVNRLIFGPSLMMMDSSIEETQFNYSAEDGRLLSKIKTIRQPFAKMCAGYLELRPKTEWGTLGPQQVTASEEEQYTYKDGVIASITRTVRKPRAAVIDGEITLPSPTATTTDLIEVRTWERIRKDDYLLRVSTLIPQYRRRVTGWGTVENSIGSLEQKVIYWLGLIAPDDLNYTQTSNAGQTQPPATERCAATREVKDIPIEGVCTLTITPSPFSPRERRYELDCAVAGPEQLTELAQLEAWRLWGRAQAVRIQVPLLDALVDNPAPLQNFALLRTEILPNGIRRNRYLYQMDGIGYEHEPNSAVVTFTGMLIGIQEGVLVPHTSTPTAPAFNSDQVKSVFQSVQLGNSDAVSSQVVINTNGAIVVQPTAPGLGLGCEPRLLPIFKPLIPLNSPAGLGLGSGNTIAAIRITSPPAGLGLGCEPRIGSQFSRLSTTIRSGGGLGLGSTPITPPSIIHAPIGLGIGSNPRLFGLRTFTYSGTPLDDDGILYFLGTTDTNYDPVAWSNPYYYRIGVTSNPSNWIDANYLNRSTDLLNRLPDQADAYIDFDFYTAQIRPISYLLQHDGTTGGYLRNWKLQGSNDTTTWVDLDTRSSNATLNSANAWGHFTCNGGNTAFYRYLRLLQTGLNSSGNNQLALAEIEFYGIFDY